MDYKIKLKNLRSSTDIVKINDDAIAFTIAKIIAESDQKYFLHITSNDAQINALKNQLNFFAADIEILTFPAWDCLPYDRVSPKTSIICERITTLSKLAQKADKKTLIITSINAALQKIIPANSIENLGYKIAAGQEVAIDDLANILVNNGYNRSVTANNIGEFAIRGNIFDIVTINNSSVGSTQQEALGYRLDFFGDNVESIRSFDPLTQISEQDVSSINIPPVSEVILNPDSIRNFKNNYRKYFGIPDDDPMYEALCEGRSYAGMEHFLPLFYEEELGNLLSYFDDGLVFIEAANDALQKERLAIINDYYQSRISTLKESKKAGGIYNPVPADDLYLQEGQFEELLSDKFLVRFSNFEAADPNGRNLDLKIKPIPDFALASKSNRRNVFDLMAEFINGELAQCKIIISCSSQGSRERLQKILLEHEIASQIIDKFTDLKALPKNQIALTIFPIKAGFYAQDLAVISEGVIFGEKIGRKKSKKIDIRVLGESMGLQIGELVVHKYHGIGKFDGLQTITTSNQVKNDFLKIIYGGGDNLFVPVEDIDLITRYGSDNPLIKLDRLGAATWKNRQERVRKRIKVAAEELIRIAAARKVKKAPILIPTYEYEEFKARFNFVETDDQLRSIDEIEEDLAAGTPMDRLVCGDVGFGKTEVAMRAAFIAAKAVSHNKIPYQVAIITPTTLLCRQHYHNFQERFKDSGLVIKQLSRMVATADAKKTKDLIETGGVNIIIGTHALLNKNIKFKNLVLVIVDEEQHFGVAQKERLKELRNE
ncbi:MAG: DEAD/DEAH box helicase, partial [Proteobacteria bacterium]|nr:DEAD/DEAH box helicase [Pseudomonadota bacterium]